MTVLSRRALIAGLGASAVVAGASAEPYSPPAVTLARAATAPGNPASLVMTDGDGDRVLLSAFAGRPVVLNLWAPWCLPCRREMPSLARLAAAEPGLAVVPLGFDWRGTAGVRRFYAETGIDNLPVLVGEGENLVAAFGFDNLPTTVILDRAGVHRYTVPGEAQWDDAATRAWLAG